VAGLGAELGEFVAVGVGLLFGALGPGPQVGAQLVTVADSVGAHAGQHVLRISADPAGLGPCGLGGGQGAGGFLLRGPGSLFCLRGRVAVSARRPRWGSASPSEGEAWPGRPRASWQMSEKAAQSWALQAYRLWSFRDVAGTLRRVRCGCG
jgi:hypothetical protein